MDKWTNMLSKSSTMEKKNSSEHAEIILCFNVYARISLLLQADSISKGCPATKCILSVAYIH